MSVLTSHSWRVADDEQTVRVVPDDLPAVASEESFAVYLDEATLLQMITELRSRQLGLDSDRTGGL